MVKRNLWTKKPHVNGNVVGCHLWTKNPQQIAAFDLLDFMRNSYLGTSWSAIRGQKLLKFVPYRKYDILYHKNLNSK